MKISVVLGYKDRLQQLLVTLRTISLFPHENVEIIIVNDSEEDLSFLSNYKNLCIRIVPFGTRPHINPCVVYNKGFEYVTGDAVVIQNPECLYLTNVYEYVRKNLTSSNYLTFSCYYTKAEDHCRFGNLSSVSDSSLIGEINKIVDLKKKQWYNHATFRPRCLHFTSAITTSNLQKLEGFDERFVDGYCFDDEELLTRIRLMGLKVEIVPPELGLVVHQYHPSGSAVLSAKHALWQKNKALFIQLFGKEPACS